MKALSRYLDIGSFKDVANNPEISYLQSEAATRRQKKAFRLIETQNLFVYASERVLGLFKISISGALHFLGIHRDRFRVASIVRQLRAYRLLQLEYLNYMFFKFRDYYNTETYKEFHVLQVALYADFPVSKYTRRASYSSRGDDIFHPRGKSLRFHPDASKHKRVEPLLDPVSDSDFITFLRFSNYAPLELALEECQSRQPPLHHEIVYILNMLGRKEEALNLLVLEIGDMRAALAFVERYDTDSSLFNLLASFCIEETEYLSELVDNLDHFNSICGQLFESIPSKMHIIGLRRKMVALFNHLRFRVEAMDSCNDTGDDDAMHAQKILNQTTRRAIKVKPSMTCGICCRDLNCLSAKSILAKATGKKLQQLLEKKDEMLVGKGDIIGQDRKAGANIVIFRDNTAFHRQCLELEETILA